MEDNPVTAIDIGALAIGITDPLHMTEAQLQQVKNFLIAHAASSAPGGSATPTRSSSTRPARSGSARAATATTPTRSPRTASPTTSCCPRRVAGVDVRLRHQRPRPQRQRRLRDAQLVRQRCGRDLRGQDLALPDRATQGARDAAQGSARAVGQQPEADAIRSRPPSRRTTPSGCRCGRTSRAASRRAVRLQRGSRQLGGRDAGLGVRIRRKMPRDRSALPWWCS